jgi:hypothetical protein
VRYHHTKNKGDLGLLHAQVDLAAKGYALLLPLTEHAPFDLVAYKAGSFLRVQVKYRSAVNGTIELRFRSAWADGRGTHVVPMNKDEIDVVCIYCPDTRSCYYVDPRQFREAVTLRIAPARNGQAKGVLHAEDFGEVPPSAIDSERLLSARRTSRP